MTILSNLSLSCITFVFFTLTMIDALSLEVTDEVRSADHALRFLQDAALGRYEIGESRIIFGGTTVTMIFPLNDLAPDNSVSITTYSDTDCSVNIDGNDFIIPEIIYDDNPSPDGTKNREVTIRYKVDPVKVQQSDIWVQREDDQFFMNFCVGLDLHSGDVSNPSSTLISGLETVVLLQVDLLGDFGGEVNVAPGDRLDEEADQAYYVEGFLCDSKNKRMVYDVPLTQGNAVKVCVKPMDEALADGVYMRRVDSFTFQREDVVDRRISQRAVVDGRSANQALTQLVCNQGSELCYFETLLNGDFYFGAGTVTGFGEAWLQFGSGASRKLRIETRQLRVDGGFAGAAYFSTNFFVLPGDGSGLNAIAYECDQWNRPVDTENMPPKLLGDGIRICVTPDDMAQRFGITINSIESWNFTRSGLNQPAIEDGNQAENGLTMLMCVPGSIICVFRTQFIPDLFLPDIYGVEGQVTGLGMVVLQYATGGLTARRRLLTTKTSTSTITGHADTSSGAPPAVDTVTSLYFPAVLEGRRNGAGAGRVLQDAEDALNIAGTSAVSVNTTVLYLEESLPERCQFEHKASEWWVQQPIEDRYMYIGVVAGTVATIACLLCTCWCCPCLSERREDDETEIIDKGDQGVAVNVDLKTEKNETNTSTATRTHEDSKKMSIVNNDTISTSHSSSSKRQSNVSEDDEETGTSSRRSRKEKLTNDGSSSRSSSKKNILLLPDGSGDNRRNSSSAASPGELDVCFSDKRHPGTRHFIRSIQSVIRKSPDEDYGPSIYKAIMEKNKGTNFFTTDRKGRYVQPSKMELRDLVGEMFKEAKRSSSRSGGGSSSRGNSNEDLKRSSNRKSSEDRDKGSSNERRNKNTSSSSSGRRSRSEDTSEIRSSKRSKSKTGESNSRSRTKSSSRRS